MKLAKAASGRVVVAETAGNYSIVCYIAGHSLNERDFVLRGIREGAARRRLLAAFRPR